MHNLELREAPLMIYKVENLRVKNWDSMELGYAPVVKLQAEIEMASLRDKNWGISYLEVVTSVEITDGKVVSFVGSSVGIGDGNLEGSLLGRKSLGEDIRSEIGSFIGGSYGSGDGKLEGYPLG